MALGTSHRIVAALLIAALCFILIGASRKQRTPAWMRTILSLQTYAQQSQELRTAPSDTQTDAWDHPIRLLTLGLETYAVSAGQNGINEEGLGDDIRLPLNQTNTADAQCQQGFYWRKYEIHAWALSACTAALLVYAAVTFTAVLLRRVTQSSPLARWLRPQSLPLILTTVCFTSALAIMAFHGAWWDLSPSFLSFTAFRTLIFAATFGLVWSMSELSRF